MDNLEKMSPFDDDNLDIAVVRALGLVGSIGCNSAACQI
jgi:hypothetical protein